MGLGELIAKRAKLLYDLESVNRQIEEAQTEIFIHSKRGNEILERYAKGEYVMVSFSRFWWVDPSGSLLQMLTEPEIDELNRLKKQGFFLRQKVF